jgi:hypothetical protein
MATRAAVTKQLARVWDDVSSSSQMAQSKLANLSSKGIYTFIRSVESHPYWALERKGTEMLAKFQELVEYTLAIEIDGIPISVEVNNIVVGLIAKGKPPNAAVNALLSLNPVPLAVLDAHNVAQLIIDADILAAEVIATCGLPHTTRLLRSEFKKKAIAHHLEVPYIQMSPAAKKTLSQLKKLVRMLLNENVAGTSVRSAFEQRVVYSVLASTAVDSRAKAFATLSPL